MKYGYTCMQANEPFEPFCEGKIFIDRMGETARPALEELLHILNEEDTVVIPTLSCLGPAFAQISDTWQQLRLSGASLVILDYPDSQVMPRDALDRMVGYLAVLHEHLSRRKTARHGHSQPGPKPKEIPEEFKFLSETYRTGGISSRAAAEQLHVSHTTFLRWCRLHEETA